MIEQVSEMPEHRKCSGGYQSCVEHYRNYHILVGSIYARWEFSHDDYDGAPDGPF